MKITRKIRGITHLDCTKCKEIKTILEFSPRHSNGSWYSWCKKCHSIQNQEYNRIRRRPNPKTNKTGFPGVTYIPHRNKYRARIQMYGRQYYLAMADTAEEAYKMYMAQKELQAAE